VTISKILVVTSSTSITVSSNANGTVTPRCVWYTQDDTLAFVRAYTTAHVPSSFEPSYGTPSLNSPQGVYCPGGGYAVSSSLLTQPGPINNEMAVNLIGAGKGACIIYLLPTFTPAAGGGTGVFTWANTYGLQVRGFTIDGLSFNFTSFATNDAPVLVYNGRDFDLRSFSILNFGDTVPFNAIAGGSLTIQYNSGASKVTNVTVQNPNTINSATNAALSCSGCTGVDFDSNLWSNTWITSYIANSGARTPTAASVFFKDEQHDECLGNTAAGSCDIFVNSNFVIDGGYWFGNSTKGPMSLDTTSVGYIKDAWVGAYNSGNNFPAITLAGNAQVFLEGSTIAGNGTGAMFSGPSTAKVTDSGSNTWLNCLSLVCTPVTAAQFTTLGFVGGVEPNSSLTHTPNTCYDVPGGVAADLLCNFKADQNYQLLNIKASSNVVVTCATPIVITITDGSQSATLTLTSGQSTWDSATDAHTGLFSVFAAGNTPTTTKAAGVCATPPVNLAVTAVYQSVLNY